MTFQDEWLVPTVAVLLEEGEIERLRTEGDRADSLWEMLTSRGRLADQEILEAIAERFRLSVANLTTSDVTARRSVPEALARQYQVLPLRITDSYLEVATANPFDMDAEKLLAFATGREVRMLLSSPTQIKERLEEHYRPEDVVSKLLDGMAEEVDVAQLEEETEDLTFSAEEAAKRPIIKLVDSLLADGIATRASDIHIEPFDRGVVVRYRIDGVLRQVMKIPRAAGIPLISRIKIMSGMDIADRLRPQDGRARVAVNGEPVDLRVSTLPAALGEKVVIRVLNTTTTTLQLDALGLASEERSAIDALLQNREGIILVTGPTGSGKTTTLYAALRAVQNEGVNIVTVEDPVEYRLGESVVQVQTNEKAGLTFASALRSILRQDPDVVLVGEIRDTETARIAVQASLTGHLVLSTLHTNDAASSVTRLNDMGMEGYKIASALRGVIAQRLLRRLCPKCKIVATDPPQAAIQPHIRHGSTLYRPVGCAECAETGYFGRLGIVEVLTSSPELERLVGEGASTNAIGQAARRAGMKSLFQSGLHRVLEGVTSIEELLRVTTIPSEEEVVVVAPAVVREPVPTGTTQVTPTDPSSHVVEPEPEFELLDTLVDPSDEPVVRKGTVLIVEDEVDLRHVMKDLLERAGYQCLEAGDGVIALDLIDLHTPDVIILDLNLPILDGYAVLTDARSRRDSAKTPIIVLTAKGDEDNEVRVIEQGATEFLTKPFRARALIARLDALLARARGTT